MNVRPPFDWNNAYAIKLDHATCMEYFEWGGQRVYQIDALAFTEQVRRFLWDSFFASHIITTRGVMVG